MYSAKKFRLFCSGVDIEIIENIKLKYQRRTDKDKP